MVVHACNCLNVKLDLGSQPTLLQEVGKPLLSDEEKGNSFFKKSEIMYFRLHPTDPVIQHPWLLSDRMVGRWSVFHCLNCRVDVHAAAILDGQKAVITGSSGIRDSSRIAALERSDLFSPAFKIVLMAEDCPTSRVMPPVDLESSSVYQRATEYLEIEEDKMLTKIQRFNDEQQAGYLKTQSRVLQERNMLLSLLAAKRNDLSYPPIHKASPSSGTVSRRPEREPSSFSSALSRSVAAFVDKPKSVARPKDALFDLDFLEVGEEVVESAMEAMEEPLSTVKEEGEMDDGEEEGMAIPRQAVTTSIAKSLPMSVPPPAGPSRLVDIDIDSTPQDPADIPFSMRAISQSIQGDVMWERPRPRLNTMN